jgi:hypothetical protein
VRMPVRPPAVHVIRIAYRAAVVGSGACGSPDTGDDERKIRIN